MPVLRQLSAGRVPVQIFTEDIDGSALAQLERIAQLPVIFHHVAVMPDVHAGIGTTVGAVIPTKSAIIPAAVGVDIGCGMNAARISLGAAQLPDGLAVLRAAIEGAVPAGFSAHDAPVVDRGVLERTGHGLERILERHPDIARMQKAARRTWALQLGTLGGGNHFIELCLDEGGQAWVLLHSGSRGTGNVIGRYFIELARRDMERTQSRLPDRDLAYLSEGTAHFDDYVAAVEWAQDYAALNRRTIMDRVLDALRPHLPPFRTVGEVISCHHNYVRAETHFGERVYVTRKGAIRAGEGELGIIPGSMGARSYVVRGKGSPASFMSSAHGAGRRMSRSQAKRRFTRSDLERQTAGVECRKDKGVLDEIPSAYKDIDSVMANQSDLVETVHTLKQVLCVKG